MEVYVDNNTIQNDINYKSYCSIRININSRTCFLEFVNASNIQNKTIVAVILRDGYGEEKKRIEDTA